VVQWAGGLPPVVDASPKPWHPARAARKKQSPFPVTPAHFFMIPFANGSRRRYGTEKFRSFRKSRPPFGENTSEFWKLPFSGSKPALLGHNECL
jgi:hypothetical protein